MTVDAPFNSQFLKLQRNEAGWTQEQLAAHADLSVRVIAKAESGQPVSRRTVLALVGALQGAGITIDPEDLTLHPEGLARRFLKSYALHHADCVEHCLDFISPEIVAVMDGDGATNPLAGEYHGIDAFDGLWRKFFSMFARAGGSLGDHPTIRCIGNEVLAWGHELVHLPEMPPVEPGFVMLRMTFQGGKMTRFEDYYEATGMMRIMHHYADTFPEAEWAKLLREMPGNASLPAD
jgi:transcriptional regulator with XRE-family HTH domain